jgi:hypothetical protein
MIVVVSGCMHDGKSDCTCRLIFPLGFLVCIAKLDFFFQCLQNLRIYMG